MSDRIDQSTCGGPDHGKESDKAKLCPVCGKRSNVMQALSDTLIDATFEVVAEEGAIWSGAR